MATYVQIYDLADSAVLKKKVAVAVSKAATDIINEAENTNNHEARARWATNAVINVKSTAEAMMWSVLGNATIQTSGESSTDDDVQFVVNSLINLFVQ